MFLFLDNSFYIALKDNKAKKLKVNGNLQLTELKFRRKRREETGMRFDRRSSANEIRSKVLFNPGNWRTS